MSQGKQICTTPLRIPPELKVWAKQQAAAKECSLNSWIIALLLDLRRQQETALP
jgi:predicted HicB family RNase H-like nuclease